MLRLRVVKVEPALAEITKITASHCCGFRRSRRKSMPLNAPIAGSTDMRIPNVRAGIARSPIISSEYGSALDKMATPKPNDEQLDVQAIQGMGSKRERQDGERGKQHPGSNARAAFEQSGSSSP